MIQAAPHRGHLSDCIELGSCILAISESGQPGSTSVASADGLAAAFSGVLDNMGDLVEDLGGADRGSPLESPAAVLIAGFRKYGLEMPKRLRGVFAGVVTDGTKIICFRDHLGYGALYYRDTAEACFVATEAKQVVAGSGISKEPDLDVLEQILFKTYDDRTPCALRGVSRLPKATVLLLDREGGRLKRYWHPEAILESATFSQDELQERFTELMSQAVQRALTGDDVVSLSGGIDSPAIAAFAAPMYLAMTGRPLPALSIVFPDLPSVDERGYVELIAKEFGMPLHTYEQQARPLDHVQEWANIADSPVPTVSLPQYQEHYETARSLGFRNMLTGELAELVCDMMLYRFPHLLLRGRFAAVWRDMVNRRSRGASIGSIGRSVLSAVVPSQVTALRWRIRSDGIPQWVDRGKANETAVRSIVPARERWRNVQVSWIEGPGISMEADEICQDLCGVRMRRPWTDVDLWEFFLSLTAEVKYPDSRSKTLVRRLLREKVPDAILDRKDKTAFDDSVIATIDYPALRRWLIAPMYRLPGIRYDLLRDRLEHEDLDVNDAMWAKDLASVHAFLALW